MAGFPIIFLRIFKLHAWTKSGLTWHNMEWCGVYISLLKGRYELNKLTSLPMCGFIAQLVEHRTGIAEVMGSNPVEALIFFRLLLSNCLNWKINCDDHSSLSKERKEDKRKKGVQSEKWRARKLVATNDYKTHFSDLITQSFINTCLCWLTNKRGK